MDLPGKSCWLKDLITEEDLITKEDLVTEEDLVMEEDLVTEEDLIISQTNVHPRVPGAGQSPPRLRYSHATETPQLVLFIVNCEMILISLQISSGTTISLCKKVLGTCFVVNEE